MMIVSTKTVRMMIVSTKRQNCWIHVTLVIVYDWTLDVDIINE